MPFWLLSWGETRIDSGLASIIQASVPIFNALLAYGFFRDQRVTGGRLVGVVIGFVGVAVLVGAQPEAKVLGALAVVGMALCYGAGGLLAPPLPLGGAAAGGRVRHDGDRGARHDARGRGAGTRSHPRLEDVRVDRSCSASSRRRRRTCSSSRSSPAPASAYASLVTYLVPPIALAYGAIFLGERFGASAFAGLALILAGVGLGTRAQTRDGRRVRRAARGGLSGHASPGNRRGRRLAGRALHRRRRRAVPRRAALARPRRGGRGGRALAARAASGSAG